MIPVFPGNSPLISAVPSVSPSTITNRPINNASVTVPERIVQQVFENAVDGASTQYNLIASVAQQLGLPVDQAVADVTSTTFPRLTPEMVNRSFLPSRVMAERMIDLYFDYTNCFHPLLDRETITSEWVFDANVC
jgi:hypothetical protein